MMPDITKRCRICELDLPLSSFGGHRGHADGLQNYCRLCRNLQNKNMLTPEQKTRKAANQQRFAMVQDRKIRRRGMRYVLTEEEFQKMKQSQNGCCWICGSKESDGNRELCVDHDHATGLVRGLLCGRCNKALGGFRDNIELLQTAITYLTQHAAKSILLVSIN